MQQRGTQTRLKHTSLVKKKNYSNLQGPKHLAKHNQVKKLKAILIFAKCNNGECVDRNES